MSDLNKNLKYKDGFYVVENEDQIEKDLEAENEIRRMELNVIIIMISFLNFMNEKENMSPNNFHSII